MLVLCLLASLLVSACGVTLDLIFINNAQSRGALCNDGSPGGYYFRKGTVNTWVLHQEGGWSCWSTETCLERAQSSPNLVSSKGWGQNVSLSGIFSDSPSENPTFYNANMVFMGYCSSDDWAGTRDPIGTNDTDAWYFKGSAITQAIVEDLLGLGLNAQSEILFTGCSAGGKGVFNNVDYVPTYLPFTPAKYLGFSDEGWSSDYVMDHTPFFEQYLLGNSLWEPNVAPECQKAHPQHQFLCQLGSIVIPYLSTPTLSTAEQYDLVQFELDCMCNFNASNTTHVEWMDGLRSAFVASFRTMEPPHSLFSPACATHCITLGDSFYQITINGTSVAMFLNKFWEAGGSIPPLIDNCSTFNCSVGCPPP